MVGKGDIYAERGVSSAKSEVHAAIKHTDPGLFPGAFCKAIPDYFTGDPDYCLVMHSDGAGTKSVAAYIAWREGFSGKEIWKGIAQDSLYMSIDDLGCIGSLGAFVVNQTIARNTFLIPGEVIADIINGCQSVCDELTSMGFNTIMCGGETEDLPDAVRTITVDNSVICRMKREDVIDASRIEPSDIIVGFSSIGRSIWDELVSLGIGSNGMTNFRHDALSARYGILYPETFCPEMRKDLAYRGNHLLVDDVFGSSLKEMILSPTRTYLPLIGRLLNRIPREHIHGIIHCSGGGQTKILKFGNPGNLYVKDNLFPVPPVFNFLKKISGIDWRQMCKTFNMGHRLEVVVPEKFVQDCLDIGAECNIEARRVGYVKNSRSVKRSLEITCSNRSIAKYVEGEE